ncbi:hypothetical protein HC928_00240 [bacterium]|nr:hypothetical protein [bacterium]
MNLFVSDISKSFEDLMKGRTGGGPRTGNPGGGARVGAASPVTSVPGPKTGNPGGGSRTGTGAPKMSSASKTPNAPSTPGAATGGTVKQIVDCPLGAACPDGGKHTMGSQKYQEHMKRAQSMNKPGKAVDDESKGEATGKPGVQPGSTNIGSLGSDQVRRPDMKTQPMKLSDQEKKLRRNEKRAKATQEMPAAQQEQIQAASAGDKTQEMPAVGLEQTQEMPARQPAPTGAGAKEQMADMNAAGEPASSNKKTIPAMTAGAEKDPKKQRQGVPNPLDPSTAPADSKPTDHYRLAKVAQESGDEETAQKQVELARKRAENMSSEDHKKLANDLRKEGFEDHASYHENIHNRVQEYSADEEFAEVEQKQSEKAKEVLEETKSKAKELSKKGKKPNKQQELKAPESNHEKLQHENHTSKATRAADVIESHLKNNSTLSDSDKKRLKRAHEMAVFHKNIGFTPTAAHKKEMAEVERTMKDLNVKEPWDDVKVREDKAKSSEKQKKMSEQEKVKQAHKEAKEQEKAAKQEAKGQEKAAKQEAKGQEKASEPEAARVPSRPIEEAKVSAHRSRAQNMRQNIESHLEGNPNMSDADRELANQILQELEKHENRQFVPTREVDAELKELEKLGAKMGKKPYEAPSEPDVGSGPRRDNAGYILSQFHTGRAVGAGLAASATSPYGGAGHLAPQIAGYGMQGATAIGHKLLQGVDDGATQQEKLDKQKEKQEKEADKQAKAAIRANDPKQVGLAGGSK